MESIKSYDYSKLSFKKQKAEFEKFIKECTWHAPGEGKNNCFINSTRYNLNDKQLDLLGLDSWALRNILVSLNPYIDEMAKISASDLYPRVGGNGADRDDANYEKGPTNLLKEGVPFDFFYGSSSDAVFLNKPVVILSCGVSGEEMGIPKNGLVVLAKPGKSKSDKVSEMIVNPSENELRKYVLMGKNSAVFIYTQGHFQPMHTDIKTRKDGIARFLGFKALGTLKQSLGQPFSKNELHHEGEILAEAETIMRKTLERKKPVSIYNQDNINNSGVDITTSKDINRV